MALKLSEKFNNHAWFWIIAGPNGSGKSTWATSEQCVEILGDIPILNPDHFTDPYISSPMSLLTAGKRIFHKIK